MTATVPRVRLDDQMLVNQSKPVHCREGRSGMDDAFEGGAYEKRVRSCVGTKVGTNERAL